MMSCGNIYSAVVGADFRHNTSPTHNKPGLWMAKILAHFILFNPHFANDTQQLMTLARNKFIQINEAEGLEYNFCVLKPTQHLMAIDHSQLLVFGTQLATICPLCIHCDSSHPMRFLHAHHICQRKHQHREDYIIYH